MIIIEKYKLIPDETDQDKLRVKSEEKSICPICLNEALKVIGSRNRSALNSKGENLIIVIRRLRCSTCKKIHHELPNILVPYKRYLSSCIEAVVEGQGDKISCENSSIYRIKRWFKVMAAKTKRSIEANAARGNTVIETGGRTKLKAITLYVGERPGWLARAVRIVVNTNNWIHTRFAFMT